MDIDKKRMLELYRNGLRVGIRRGSGATVCLSFDRLWELHRDFLQYDLKMLALDENWGSLLLADKVCKTIASSKNTSDGYETAFGFVGQLTKARSSRMAYYLTRILMEPWIEIKESILSRQIPKKEWMLVQRSVGDDVTDKSFWSPLLSACGGDGAKSEYVSICKELSGLAETLYDRQLPRTAAILAVVEPSLPEMTDSINADMVDFSRLSGVSWNYVHPESYVGGKAISAVALDKEFGVTKEEVRINWLYKYTDQSVNPERSFWQAVYDTRANARTKGSRWHMMAVKLMAECQKWIDTHKKDS